MARNATGDLEVGVDGYATYAGVMELVPHLSLNYSSRPTKLQAIRVIRESFDVLNGMFSRKGYDVPIPSGNATTVNIAARLHSLDAASLIEQVQYSTGNSAMSEHATALLERRNNLWKEFDEGNITLLGATRTGDTYQKNSDEQQPEAQFHVVSGTEQSPVFTRNMNF
jgi:hypothetical protein